MYVEGIYAINQNVQILLYIYAKGVYSAQIYLIADLTAV